MKRPRALVLSLVFLTALLGACSSWSRFYPFRAWRDTTFTEEELREDLLGFASHFASVVSRAGDQIIAAEPRSATRKRVLLWKIRLTPLVQEGALVDDPQEAYVQVFTIVIMMRQYLSVGDGSEIFGAEQPVALEAAAQLEMDIVAIGEQFLDAGQLQRVRDEVAEFTRKRVIAGGDFSVASFQQTASDIRASGYLDWLIDLPMSPFRALEGVGSGAAAIHDFNDTALRFARIVEGIPTQLRWQSELLAYDLETIDSVVAARAAMRTISESASRITEVAAQYPEDLSRLLGDSGTTLSQAQAVLLEAKGILGPLSEVVAQLNQASASWATLLGPKEPGTPAGRPFDIREWESAARAIGDGAARLQGLATELREIGDSPALATALGSGADEAAAQLEASGRKVVDHAAWRVLQLLVALFVLMYAYHLLTRRRAGADS